MEPQKLFISVIIQNDGKVNDVKYSVESTFKLSLRQLHSYVYKENYKKLVYETVFPNKNDECIAATLSGLKALGLEKFSMEGPKVSNEWIHFDVAIDNKSGINWANKDVVWIHISMHLRSAIDKMHAQIL